MLYQRTARSGHGRVQESDYVTGKHEERNVAVNRNERVEQGQYQWRGEHDSHIGSAARDVVANETYTVGDRNERRKDDQVLTVMDELLSGVVVEKGDGVVPSLLQLSYHSPFNMKMVKAHI